MIAAIIAALAAVVVALIGRSTRKAVNNNTEQNTADHLLVVNALQGLDVRVGQVHEMLWDHVTDRDIHGDGQWVLRSPLRKVNAKTTYESSGAPDPSRIEDPAPILEPDVQTPSD